VPRGTRCLGLTFPSSTPPPPPPQALLKLQEELGGVVLPTNVVTLHLTNVGQLLDDYGG
jgi:hypothetical protein